jgi:hypothetical protein
MFWYFRHSGGIWGSTSLLTSIAIITWDQRICYHDPLLAPFAFLFPPFWFGWTSCMSIHWIVPISGTGFFDAGSCLLFVLCLPFAVCFTSPVYLIQNFRSFQPKPPVCYPELSFRCPLLLESVRLRRQQISHLDNGLRILHLCNSMYENLSVGLDQLDSWYYLCYIYTHSDFAAVFWKRLKRIIPGTRNAIWSFTFILAVSFINGWPFGTCRLDSDVLISSHLHEQGSHISRDFYSSRRRPDVTNDGKWS